MVQGDPAVPDTRRSRQCASAVLMVRPAAFGPNPQTAASNRFQCAPDEPRQSILTRALEEFDRLERALGAAGVETIVCTDRAEPRCPDAVFPNNWVTLHADGTVVLYPMLAPNRRLERRTDLLADLARHGFGARRLADLTHHELAGRFLEGTGSVVFDHVNRLAFACLSPRTHPAVLAELAGELGYEPVAFAACDCSGVPVYHTNVLLSIGRRGVIVCDEAIAAVDRNRVLGRLAAAGRTLVTVDQRGMADFTCNALELEARDGSAVLAMSERAFAALAAPAREVLTSGVDRIVTAAIPTIEACGGGSVRCMLAEVFLPRQPPAPESSKAAPARAGAPRGRGSRC